MLSIQNLYAKIEEENKEILKGVSLDVRPGEVHAIMGINGSGKSTLSKIVTGYPGYEVTKGDIQFDGESILEMDPDEIAQKGIFLAFQYPVEIPGVNNKEFLKMALNAHRKALGQDEIDVLDFELLLKEKMDLVKLNPELLNRAINQGFSGGEKKRNEILQLALLEPKIAFLDETDSGLDIDALKAVSDAVNALRSPDRSFVVITHYQRLLNYIQPDVVHVFYDGQIVKSGDKHLAERLEAEGYDWVQAELGVTQ